jgi:predicted amidohydrolase
MENFVVFCKMNGNQQQTLYIRMKFMHIRVFSALFVLVLLGLSMADAGLCANKADKVRDKTPDTIRIALVHLDARPGEVARNRSRIEAAISEAVARKADWIMTPELAETGYGFVKKIGTDWIENFPDDWVRKLSGIARGNRVTLFIGLAEKDSTTGKLHNSVAVIGRDGVIQGTYRKHRVVNGPAEKWASPGQENNLFIADGIPVGLLICADAYKTDIASRHKLQGARILLSPANWPQAGHMGPNAYWKARTQETGLPLIVNNRTGKEPELDFSSGESTLVILGRRVFNFNSKDTKNFYLDWNIENNSFAVVPDRPNLP